MVTVVTLGIAIASSTFATGALDSAFWRSIQTSRESTRRLETETCNLLHVGPDRMDRQIEKRGDREALPTDAQPRRFSSQSRFSSQLSRRKATIGFTLAARHAGI
jgi:hypothetical protein